MILAQTYEYSHGSRGIDDSEASDCSQVSKVDQRAGMSSRYLGLIVVPGQYITKMVVVPQGDASGAGSPSSVAS